VCWWEVLSKHVQVEVSLDVVALRHIYSTLIKDSFFIAAEEDGEGDGLAK
jgi:hypothetical protein